LFLIFITV